MEEEIQNSEFVGVTNDTLIKVFFRMFLGLLATGGVALYTYSSGLYLTILTGVSYGLVALIELIVVLLFTFLFRKLSPLAVTILFYLYAFINGITLSVIFAVFEIESIFLAFFATAFLFGGLALYGYKTQKDISKIGPMLMITMIVGLIVSIINIFIGSTIIDLAVDWLMLFIFCGLTIYDINKIKLLGEQIEGDQEKLYIYGAMQLYLDFINMFIRILSLFGKRKN